MKKVVAVILIITGIALIAYPKLREAYYDHKQEQLLREWENSMALPELQDTGEAGEDEEGVVEDNEQAETAEKMLERMRYIEENMEGMLKEVIKKDVSYVYEVFEKIIVKPEETWVLAPQGRDRLITLVTCDYSSKPTLRLIVRGKLVEN